MTTKSGYALCYAAALAVASAGAACTSGRHPGMAAAPCQTASPGAAFVTGGNTTERLREHVSQSLHGKTIAWVPLMLGLPLTEEWTHVMRAEAEARGLKLEVRDPNLNTTAGLQAVSALIAERPAVLVVHNPNVQLYASELERAEQAGIYVIQVNMVSNFKTAAYVGPDWRELGRRLAQQVVASCGSGSGRSGKVQIVQGELTSGVSIDQLDGIMQVLRKDPAIHVVSSQGADWDANKAHDITATVIQQHPDLCASIGFWGVMEAGAAQAIKAAGKLDSVKIYASGGDGTVDCNNIDNGLFTRFLAYDTASQARTIIDIASFLLQSGTPPASTRTALYSSLHWMDKGKYDHRFCYDWTRAPG
jgi:ribose transport system substrate-binding protein